MQQIKELKTKDTSLTDAITKKQRWTESMAVGSKRFVTDILSQLGSRVNGRKIIEKGQTSQIREEIQPYNPLFKGKNSNIAPENTMFWHQDAYEQRM